MKPIHIFIVLMLSGAGNAHAQQVFSNAIIGQYQNHDAILFTVPSEVNVYQYRVEAGNDSTDLEVIGAVHPAGNSVFARSYHFDIYEPGYLYYRIGMVGMGSGIRYSKMITANKQEMRSEPVMDSQRAVSGPTVVRNR